jgi:hypothetical protein
MWYGYAFEAIYIVLGTALFATVLGILIYHWSDARRASGRSARRGEDGADSADTDLINRG